MSLITPSFGHSFYINNEDTTPSQPLVMSPLRKRARPPELKGIVKQTLKDKIFIDEDVCFGEKKNKYTSESSSCENFEVNNSPFCLPVKLDPFLDKLNNVDIKEQAELILNSTPFQNFSTLKKEKIRSIILGISEDNQLDTNSKCAELGVLYFYIASKELLIDSKFIQFRTEELLAEANTLIKKHEECCPVHLRTQIPTGCKAYLLFAFARMIFPSDGGFNPGGCKALKIMMESPLQRLIAEEERLQMIRLADRLLADKNFVLLFQKPFTVHKDLQELISIDLQLHKDEEINFIYLRWDLLIALISSISQHDSEKNCFAIATVSNLLVNNPEILLKMLIEALKTGKMEFSGHKFPVLTMLESARMNETDFNKIVSHQSVSNLIPFSLARESLDVELTDQATHYMPLDKYLTLVFSDKAYYAKQLYLSTKQNLLQKLLISMVQFAAINTNSKGFYENDDLLHTADTNQLEEHSNKESLIYDFIKDLKLHLKANSNEYVLSEQDGTYLHELENALLEKLYVVDYNNWKVTHDDKKVFFNFHKKGLNYNGKISDYNGLVQERRLCFFKNGDLIPVDSISELKSCFLEIVNQFYPDVKTGLEGSLQAKIIDFVSSNAFEGIISEILFTMNKNECPLEAAIYKDSNSLIFAQNGSFSAFLKLWEPLRFKLSFENIQAATPEDFFVTLCGALAKLDHETDGKFAKLRKWVLVECTDHLYNICPHMFHEYWADEFKESWGTENFKFDRTILDRAFFNRIKNYLFSAEKKKRVLLKVTGRTSMENHFSHLIHSNLNIAQFFAEAKKLLGWELHAALNTIIYTVMNEIPTKEIKALLKTILLDIVDNNDQYDCLKLIMERIEAKGLKYFSPYGLSELIHETLIAVNLPAIRSKNAIEKHIRKWASMPEVIDIGNMNWTTTLSEKPVYSYLSICYDFTKGLTFCYRVNGAEKLVSEEHIKLILDTTKIYLPCEM